MTHTDGDTLLSVVVPVFELGDCLNTCMSSLLADDDTRLQVVVVDDGSTREDARIIDDCAARDGRVTAVHRENGGVSSARNAGIDAARGAYVSFVDGDDLVDESYVSTLLTYADTADVDILVFGGHTRPATAWMDAVLCPPDDTRRGRDACMDALGDVVGCTPFTFNKMYRTSMLREGDVRFDTRFALGEDSLFQYAVWPFAESIRFDARDLYVHTTDRSDSAMVRNNADASAAMDVHIDLFAAAADAWKAAGVLDDRRVQLQNGLADLFWAASLFDGERYAAFAARLVAMLRRFGFDPYAEGLHRDAALLYSCAADTVAGNRLRARTSKMLLATYARATVNR